MYRCPKCKKRWFAGMPSAGDQQAWERELAWLRRWRIYWSGGCLAPPACSCGAETVEEPSHYGPRFERALSRAARLHREQTRKGTDTPYVSHLLAVAALAIEEGADEDVAIAALLHDAVEDQGGKDTLAAIRRRFGGRVAAIVEATSDTDKVPKPPWSERKQAYVAHLRDQPDDVKLISACDKLHNATRILEDLREIGAAVWDRFNAPEPRRESTLWYYREVTKALAYGRWRPPLVDRLRSIVETIERESAVAPDRLKP